MKFKDYLVEQGKEGNPLVVWIGTWAIILVMAIFVTIMSGCSRRTPEEIAEYRKVRKEQAEWRAKVVSEMYHACDKNDGISEVNSCYGLHCDSYVRCKDGMMKEFNGVKF